MRVEMRVLGEPKVAAILTTTQAPREGDLICFEGERKDRRRVLRVDWIVYVANNDGIAQLEHVRAFLAEETE